MAEDFGVQGRGKFYEEVGALRDVVAEPPAPGRRAARDGAARRAGRRGAARREGEGVPRDASRSSRHDLVRGQFDGYRDEDGVAPDSDVETFVAVRLHIDSWRWAGVPFYIRAGKNLPVTCTEVRVELHRPPQQVFAEYEPTPARHELPALPARARRSRSPSARGRRRRVRTSPATSVELYLCDDHPGEMRPYERLLGDAMRRRDAAVRARGRRRGRRGAVVDDVLTEHAPVIPYPVHTWGPKEQDRPDRGSRRVARPDVDLGRERAGASAGA